MAKEPIDPRARPTDQPRDIRPVVARPSAGISGWALALAAVAAGVLLFAILDAHRRSLSAPAFVPPSGEVTGSAAPPPLYVPPEPPPVVVVQPIPTPVPTLPPPPLPQPARPPQIVYVPQPAPMIAPPPPQPPMVSRNASSGPAVVFDGTAAQPGEGRAGATTSTAPSGASAGSTDRARAAMFANRASTVAQGTLIPAVLETAFDSSRAGFARALVQRDIRGFDGTRVLIPRGSRLFGEYQGVVAQGQKRALINWTRLIRPDGVTIAIGSPAADPVGRTGIKANVNSHFFERFAGAFLQSALNVGVNLAARSSGSPVIVALPGSTQGITGTIQPTQIPPTLTVAQGTSISVLAARDLDFSSADRER